MEDPKSDFEYEFNEKVRLVILGEASTLTAFFLKNNPRINKSNYSQISRLSSLIIEDEDEIEFEEDHLVIDPLIKSLIILKSVLSKKKLYSVDVDHIKPFCDVIVNKDVSGPITGFAIQSIYKFLNYGFIKDGQIARMIGESVTKARFVGTDSSSDEAVLMKILYVLESLIVQPFYSLTNGVVCEIMQSCFRIAFESRLSDLLRKSAVKSLTEMVRALFCRISVIDKNSSDFNYCYQDKNNASYYKLNRMGRRFASSNHGMHSKKVAKANKDEGSDLDITNKNYNLACIHELLAYLISLINPLPDGQNSDYMISVGLNLLTVIFESTAREIGNRYCLLSIVKTDLCWNLIQLLQKNKNLSTFASVLRLSLLIFVNLRMHLKYQFETLLLRLMDIITLGTDSLEFRDVCIEYILLFFRHIPFLPHELYFNFDCDPYAPNLLEDLLRILSKNCFAHLANGVNQTQSFSNNCLNFTSLQMLSFECLLSNLKSLQKIESCKDLSLSANPATMVVNVSNIKDLGTTLKRSLESDYNICNSLSNDVNSIKITIEDIEEHDKVEEESNPVEPTPPSQQPEQIGQEGDVRTVNSLSDSRSSPSPPNELLDNFELVNTEQVVPVSVPTTPVNNQQQEVEVVSTTQINKYCVTYIFPDSNMLVYTSEQIEELKQKKILLSNATQLFNQKPAKGVDYLKEHGLVKCDEDIVVFLKNNPNVDKKQIGDYISNKKNMNVLAKFVESFAFKDTRIDEALRIYLESFRLPGEAPLISHVLEQFAHHWHESNNCPFANEDAAFSLSYAIIMLNVDQHNFNVKRQSTPMRCEEFVSNLRQVNGGKDFDKSMLEKIYHVIKSNEIIMPAEQTGVIRDKYLWKNMLKTSETVNGIYWFYYSKSQQLMNVFTKKDSKEFTTQLVILNKSIFDISWSPSISALTLVFDMLNPDKQPNLARRILNNGFTSYSLLCANYGHNYLDNLIVTLSKFVITSTRITKKNELVAHCLFGITKEYANEMRSSWVNIVQLVLFWYDNKILDGGFDVEDFATDTKLIFSRQSRVTSRNNKLSIESTNQSNFLFNFYSYFASNMNEDEQKANEHEGKPGVASNSGDSASLPNEYCQALSLIIEESKFLHIDSLIELIKALISTSLSEEFDDDIEVFKLEIILKVILMNRDRVSIFWDYIFKYTQRLMKHCFHSPYLTERLISTIFRLAIRFTPRPDALNDQIFLMIHHMFHIFKPYMIQQFSTAKALNSYVLHCRNFFTKRDEWSLVFNFILAIGINYIESPASYDDELFGDASNVHEQQNEFKTVSSSKSMPSLNSQLDSERMHIPEGSSLSPIIPNSAKYQIVDLEAYEKCVDILSSIIHEYLPDNAKLHLQNGNKTDSFKLSNFEVAIMTVGVVVKFVQASINKQGNPLPTALNQDGQSPRNGGDNKKKGNDKSRFTRITNAILSSSEGSDSDDGPGAGGDTSSTLPPMSIATESCAVKLLDMMHFFHLNAIKIVGESVPSELLWTHIWCPLLQAISFFCCDSRRPVRTYAFTYLHRTLLLHDLNSLNALQWESCFNEVLFPLLSRLLLPINMGDPIGIDETRMRTTNLLCKVFLQHLNVLLTLNTFTALWLTILDFMDKYIRTDMQTDLVREAIPESLKNILLVMKTAGCFRDTLAAITWDRINVFLPNLYKEMMQPEPHEQSMPNPSSLPSSSPPPPPPPPEQVVAETENSAIN